MTSLFIHAIGRVQSRFPSLSIEKEFAQVESRSDVTGPTDHQVFSGLLGAPENRYLARRMNWVLTTQDVASYLLDHRDLTAVETLQTIRHFQARQISLSEGSQLFHLI
jgi:hypothetical protein